MNNRVAAIAIFILFAPLLSASAQTIAGKAVGMSDDV
jgi:hypothetical protein